MVLLPSKKRKRKRKMRKVLEPAVKLPKERRQRIEKAVKEVVAKSKYREGFESGKARSSKRLCKKIMELSEEYAGKGLNGIALELEAIVAKEEGREFP